MRILHVGNIANNAYIFSHLLQDKGVNSCAISPNYHHIMGYPIWENKEMVLDEADHFFPKISREELDQFPWFSSGTWKECFQKISSYLEGTHSETVVLSESVVSVEKLHRRILKKLRSNAKKQLPNSLQVWIANNLIHRVRTIQERGFLKKFDELFDVIIFYGPSTNLIARKRIKAYKIGLEHGTLREYIFAPFKRSRDSKLGYMNSDMIFVTNQDSLPSIEKLNYPESNVVCIPHPNLDQKFPDLRAARLIRKNEIIEKPRILIPARHTYGNAVDMGKGTEVILAAVIELIDIFPHVIVEFIEWGNDVAESKKFLDDNCDSALNIEWSKLKSRPLLRKSMASTSVVIDQMKIQAYGALTADSLGLGVPAITAHSCTNDVNFFGSCAPVLPASSQSEIVQQVSSILSAPEQFENNLLTNATWYDQNLSSDVLLTKTLGILQRK